MPVWWELSAQMTGPSHGDVNLGGDPGRPQGHLMGHSTFLGRLACKDQGFG